MERAIVVTGAAHGIGRALALGFGDNGTHVVALDIDGAGLASLKHSTSREHLTTIVCDVSSEEQVARAIQTATTSRRRIDGLINNAAIANPTNLPLEHLDFSAWRRVLSTNLDSVYLCTRACLAELRRTSGAVVNVASTRALQSEPNTEAYAASKGGVVALTHALAISLGPRVRVNCISPGWIDTRGPGSSPLKPEDHAQHPVGRVGRSEDVVELAKFLLSDRAGFITGQNFVVDGGMTRKMIYAE